MDKTVTVGFSCPETLAEHIKEVARKEDRSVSRVVRRAVEAYFDPKRAKSEPEPTVVNVYKHERFPTRGLNGPLIRAGAGVGKTKHAAEQAALSIGIDYAEGPAKEKQVVTYHWPQDIVEPVRWVNTSHVHDAGGPDPCPLCNKGGK